MLQAFFDDADSFKDSGSLCLAGYVSDQQSWTAFSNDWSTLLNKHQIGYLHISDFLSGQSPYRTVKLINDGRINTVSEFAQVIRAHALFGISVNVDTKAYKELTARERKKLSVERFCFYRLLRKIIARIAQCNPHEHLSIVFNDSTEYSTRFCSALRDLKIRKRAVRDAVASISFANDAMVLPLQAAELLASITTHEMRKGVREWLDSPFHDLLRCSYPFDQSCDEEFWDRDEIIKHIPSIRAATTRD